MGPLALRTAIDVGCGMGFFCEVLHSLGLQVTGVDGRQENAEEAQRRYPGIPFRVINAEQAELAELGKFDLVLCFGLLYHLENPLRAIRNLHALTGKVLLAESMCYPGKDPMLALVDETRFEDQGLNFFALYPTEACLVKMFYRAGFSFVYRFAPMPDHLDYIPDRSNYQVRTMLAASNNPLTSALLQLLPEPQAPIRPWEKSATSRPPSLFARLQRFAGNPWSRKLATLRRLAGGEEKATPFQSHASEARKERG